MGKKRFRLILAAALIAARALWPVACAQAEALPAAGQPPPAPRPKVCLVLSGGGARGMAHIGVLKVLEELQVPIDCIAGTSMGAVVGGLYASGMRAGGIESMMLSVDWQDAFRDTPPRRDLAFRRKQDDRNFLVRLPIGLRHSEFLLPKGLIQGQKLQQTLRTLTLPYADMPSFDALPIPFRAVATDLESGSGVLLDKGDLALAMRASMSAPGVFAPVDDHGRLLVDGGVSENLPLDIGRAMGADVLIVVDVTFPLQTRKELDSPLAISNQMLAILIRQNADRQKGTLGAQDVLIEPDLAQISSTDFFDVARTIRLGERAARDLAPRLATLRLDAEAYRQYTERRMQPPAAAPLVRFVRVDAQSKTYEKTITAALRPLLAKPLDKAEVDALITELYGLGDFETIDYSVVTEGSGADEQTGIEIHARRKSWGPNYLRFGLNLQDDFQGNSRYNAATRFLVTEINPLGAEWRTDLQIGNNPKAISEFYQPLSAERLWFVAPSVRIEARDLPIYANDVQVADFHARETEGDLDFGRDLGDWGELRVGYHRINGAARVHYGNPALVDADFNNGEYFFKFSIDRLDNVDFPRQGSTLTLQWDADRLALGSDFASDRVTADWLEAFSAGRNTLILWTSAGTTLDGNIGASHIQDFYTLGGFLSLSGLAPQALYGPNYAIARAIYFRKVGRGGEGFFDFPVYLGTSFEAGNTWQRRGDIGWGGAHKDFSLFLGLDTLVGPLFIGSGYDQSGNNAFFLFLGRTF
ncbi:MAG: patatin-like phospholipase family protein [Steroidobacterales bacterium]